MSGVWTNNWRGLKNLMILGCYQDGMTTMRDTSGNAPINPAVNNGVWGISPFGAYSTYAGVYYSGVRFGTGNGTPGVTDTNLFTSAPDTVAITAVQNGTVTYDIPNGSATRTIKVTVQNRSTTDNVTITEYGIFSGAVVYSGSLNSGQVLVYHELLDTSVTLVPQQTAILELSLTMTLSDPI